MSSKMYQGQTSDNVLLFFVCAFGPVGTRHCMLRHCSLRHCTFGLCSCNCWRIAPIPCVVKNYALSLLTDIPWSVFVPGACGVFAGTNLLWKNARRYFAWAASHHGSSCLRWNTCADISRAGDAYLKNTMGDLRPGTLRSAGWSSGVSFPVSFPGTGRKVREGTTIPRATWTVSNRRLELRRKGRASTLWETVGTADKPTKHLEFCVVAELWSWLDRSRSAPFNKKQPRNISLRKAWQRQKEGGLILTQQEATVPWQKKSRQRTQQHGQRCGAHGSTAPKISLPS